jgi:hypothetical protein
MPDHILLDSSFLYALFDKDDDKYASARSFSESYRFQALVPQVVLNEVFFLAERNGGTVAPVNFLQYFLDSSAELASIDRIDLVRVRDIRQKYASARLDFVDCCIMALSERLNITKVCTFDRRDFSIFRPNHCDALELLP